MKKDKKKNVSKKDLDKYVAKDIKEVSKGEKFHLFNGKQIAISISDSPDIEKLGFSDDHIKDFIVEVTRYLIIHGGNLIYGGDLRKDGYTRLFSALIYNYRPSKEAGKVFFQNYFSFPIHLNLKQSDLLEFKKNGVEAIRVGPPEDIVVDKSKFYIPEGVENLYVWAKSLSEMRRQMQSNSDARIFTGGNLSNFKGKYPGLLEESILALSNDIPVYFIGLFGGMTQRIIDALNRNSPNELKMDWQSSENSNYEELVNFYNSKSDDMIDYEKVVDFLNNYSLERLSKNNGLSIEENKRLFSSTHSSEIIFLIMKGLQNTFSK